MASFDQLSPEQRAIIELVLKQGKSYEGLGEMLGMPGSRIRELAVESLVTLAPVSAADVDEEWRGQIADYLLQQQSGAESSATRAHLRRSEGARGWSRSILDSLEQFYDPANLPAIPQGDGAAPSRTRAGSSSALRERPQTKEAPPARPGEGRRELSPEAKAMLRRRRIIAGAAIGLVALIAILAWPIGVLTGGDGDERQGSREPRRAPRVIGQLLLRPVEKAKGTGVAVIAARGRQRQLIVQAQLPVTRRNQAYEVWLYNSDRDARSLGAQVTDREGMFQGAGPLPDDVARYGFIDVSRERVDRNARHSGVSVLRGRIADFQRPPSGAQGRGSAPNTRTAP